MQPQGLFWLRREHARQECVQGACDAAAAARVLRWARPCMHGHVILRPKHTCACPAARCILLQADKGIKCPFCRQYVDAYRSLVACVIALRCKRGHMLAACAQAHLQLAALPRAPAALVPSRLFDWQAPATISPSGGSSNHCQHPDLTCCPSTCSLVCSACHPGCVTARPPPHLPYTHILQANGSSE